MTPLMELRNVSKVFGGNMGTPKANVALDDMTFTVEENYPNIITIAGESGSGKTTMLMLLLGFYEPTVGEVDFRGKNIYKLNKDEQIDFRRNVQAVFQDPFAVYNPYYKVDNLLSIPIHNFKLAASKDEAYQMMSEALTKVGLRPEETLGRYPHQLSGGQRQRIAVARSLVLKPKLLVADEPVSMVDASLRATLLKQIRELNRDLKIPVIYITHDLTTAYHVSDHIMVLYHGSVMEAGDVEQVITAPKHPYTQLLVNSIPWPDPKHPWGEAVEVTRRVVTGNLGCKFLSRCPHAFEPCATSRPPLYEINPGSHVARCFLYRNTGVLEQDKLSTLFVAKE
jgi:oligopeptide/dipeptide ABC transporter ATP-binding protein